MTKTEFQQDIPSSPQQLAEKANQVISGLKDQYIVQTRSDIEAMRDFLIRAKTAKPQKRFKLIRTDFFQKMHDMKGLGATFGYSLLTALGKYACDYLRNKTEISDDDIHKMELVLNDTIRVLDDDLVGTGGAIGAEIYSHITS